MVGWGRYKGKDTRIYQMEEVVRNKEFLQNCHWNFFLHVKTKDHTVFALALL